MSQQVFIHFLQTSLWIPNYSVSQKWVQGIFKRKVEVRKVSNIHQLRDVVMEEWKSIPVATCEALVNSMPRRVKAILDIDGGHTKYWELTWCMLILTTSPKGVLTFVGRGLAFNDYILSYFEGKIN